MPKNSNETTQRPAELRYARNAVRRRLAPCPSFFTRDVRQFGERWQWPMSAGWLVVR